MLFGQCGEVTAVLQLLLDLLGQIFGLDQDVTRLSFLFGLQQLDLIVIELAGVGIRHRTLDDLFEIQFAKGAALEIREAAFISRTFGQFALFCSFGKQLVVDQELKQRHFLLVFRHGAHVRPDLALGDGKVCLGHRLPIDGGDHLVLGEGRQDGGERHRTGQGNGQDQRGDAHFQRNLDQ